MTWLADERRRLDRKRERLALEWAASVLASWEKRLGRALKGSYFDHCPRDEEGHCLPSGEADRTGSGEDEGNREPARPSKPAAQHPRPKQLRAAARYRDPARRRRVIAAIKREAEVAKGIAAYNLEDSEPADCVLARDAEGRPIVSREGIKRVLSQRAVAVQTLQRRSSSPQAREQAEQLLALPLHLLEIKTLLVSAKGTVRMTKAAQARKRRWEDKYGASFSLIAIDDRRGRNHSGHRLHVAVGELAGSFRLATMDRVADFGDLLARLCPECKKGERKWLTSRATW